MMTIGARSGMITNQNFSYEFTQNKPIKIKQSKLERRLLLPKKNVFKEKDPEGGGR